VVVGSGLLALGVLPAAPAAASTTPQGCAAPGVGQVSCAALATSGSPAVTKAAMAAAATTPAGLSPADLRAAYGFQSSATGFGQTVAVVTAYDDATAESDMGTYRSEYNIPACTSVDGCFSKVNQTGGDSYPAAGPAGWSLATAQALDMISAICPNCHITVVEANSTAITDLGPAENEAVSLGAKFVTNTWFATESTYGSSEPTYDSEYFNHPGVAITAPDGNGAGYGVYYPAVSPDVIAVGGTTLTADSGAWRGWAESAWPGTGSGCSAYEAKPSWQTDTGCATRMANDISAVADPTNSPIAFYDTSSGDWVTGGGNNAAAAIIAAAFALGPPQSAASYPASYLYAHAAEANDITTGSDGTCSPAPAYFCTTGPGYDGPTGIGTPSPTLFFNSTTAAPAVYDQLTGNFEVYATSASGTLEEDAWTGSAWTGLRNLGGSVTGTPSAAYDPVSGNFEVYATGTNGALEEDAWNHSTGWSGLTDVGGHISGSPSAVYDPVTGNFEVYAATNGPLFQDAYTKNGWAGWKALGGSITGSPSAVYDQASGNFEVYVTGSSGAVEEDAWTGSAWTGLKSLGGSITGSPDAVYDKLSGSLEVYAATNGPLFEDAWNKSVGGWTGWKELGGSITGTPSALYDQATGNFEVYATGTGGTLEEDAWSPSMGWTGLKSLGGSITGSPAAVYDQDTGDLEVYAVNEDGDLAQIAWSKSGDWSAWQDLGGPVSTP
jgi:hypothetical protein